MITNFETTVYHKDLDDETRDIVWIRHNYKNTWFFGGKGAGIAKGFPDANDVDIRIWYDLNEDLNVNDFAIGDIIIKGKVEEDINTQDDLSAYQIYNITSINNNNFGINQHIHIGGR